MMSGRRSAIKDIIDFVANDEEKTIERKENDKLSQGHFTQWSDSGFVKKKTPHKSGFVSKTLN